ncbi:hypothetical protein ABIB86_000469 [Bradyrhizobium sp. JR1.7]|uniref:hypothetical protein n=1 Tax=unclassified Bradyrhizobium TaxID=2631580 RepID=UPI003395867E
MRKAKTVSGTFLGVDFSVDITESSDETLTVSGVAGGMPATLNLNVGDDFCRVSGSLLGKPVHIAIT